jgi:hypothetical protein
MIADLTKIESTTILFPLRVSVAREIASTDMNLTYPHFLDHTYIFTESTKSFSDCSEAPNKGNLPAEDKN